MRKGLPAVLNVGTGHGSLTVKRTSWEGEVGSSAFLFVIDNKDSESRLSGVRFACELMMFSVQSLIADV